MLLRSFDPAIRNMLRRMDLSTMLPFYQDSLYSNEKSHLRLAKDVHFAEYSSFTLCLVEAERSYLDHRTPSKGRRIRWT